MTTTLSKANSGDDGARLGDEDVEAGAGDPALGQRVGQGLLVDQAAAGGVDDAYARLDGRQLLLADQAQGLRGPRQVHRDEVALPQQLVQPDQAYAELRRPGRLDVRVVGDQPGAEGGHALGEQHADPAEPDHPDGLALHLDAGVLRPLPLAAS